MCGNATDTTTYLHILCGISGSGKSRYAKEVLLPTVLGKCVIVSTDAIREELGLQDMEHTGEVFEEAYKRTRTALKENTSVIFDATSLSPKRRRAVLEQAKGKGMNIKTQAHVILVSPERAVSNQTNPDRTVSVPVESVMQQLRAFVLPEMAEGFTEPVKYYCAFPEESLADYAYARLFGVEQFGKWHIEDAGVHTQMVVAEAVKRYPDDHTLVEAARYHDIGKLYTAFRDEDGWHFHGHAGTGAYMFLCSRANGDKVSDKDVYIARLIQHHDDTFREYFNEEKYRNVYGDEFVDELLKLRECDMAGMITPEQLRKMQVTEILNHWYLDWVKILSSEPLYIRISKDVIDGTEYLMLQYSHIDTDMSYMISRQCRGSIFVRERGEWRYACRPYDKFFNCGEKHADSIDWSTSRVTAKIDGSLMKAFYHNGKWRLATSGQINAYTAYPSTTRTSFGEIFERAAGAALEDICRDLDKECTYMFELTSPETKVVIPYTDGVYYLACRRNDTGDEIFERPHFTAGNVLFPEVYDIHDIETAKEVVNSFSSDKEGLVVNDVAGHRLKIKGEEYLNAFWLWNNGVLTPKRAYILIRNKQDDDLTAYHEIYRPVVEDVKQRIKTFSDKCERAWADCREERKTLSKKDFADHIAKWDVKDYIFMRMGNPELTPEEYLFSKLTATVVRILGLKD